jgi:hypothetical protein
LVSGKQLDDENNTAVPGTFPPRKIGAICEPDALSLSFRATVNESGCGVETEVHAWLESQTGLRDLLETGRGPSNAICGEIEAVDTGVIAPSATASSTAPQAETIAFSGQHSPDCGRERDSVGLLLENPGE